MIIKSLGKTDFEVIIECFLEAFQNYFVKMPTDYNYYRQRWKAARVDFNLSFGVFDNEKLVAFIINAVDSRAGHTIAYNTGTGVIPSYRGQRLVMALYDYAIPILKTSGITKCTLEVIVENEKAIKAYTAIGFKSKRTLKCYAGELQSNQSNTIIKELQFKDIDWSLIPNQEKYSWDFHRHSLKHGNSKYYQVFNINDLESFFALNPDNGTVNQLEVLKDASNNWERLFSAVATISNPVRIINVDKSLKDKVQAIKTSRLKNTVNQYEMELLLL